MTAYFNAATDAGEPLIAPDLGVTQWIDAAGQPLEVFGLPQMGAGYKLLFCFQHTCSDCPRIGFPALVKLFAGLRGHSNVRFAAIQTVIENFEFNTYAGILNDQLAYSLPIPFGHDDGLDGSGSVVMQRFGGKGTPWFILIDPAGRVIHNHFHIDVYKTIAMIERTPHMPPPPAKNWGDVVRWANHGNPPPPRRVEKTDAEWRALLTLDQYYVTRAKGTEPAHSSAYCTLFEPGIYHCVCCNTPQFNNDNKFRSRSGWPSFTQPLAEGLVAYHLDEGHGMRRIETTCQVCDAHLGHVFPDGPEPTGLRYCINALALRRDQDLAATPHATNLP